MTFPTLPRRWGEILALAGLTFGLTATLVTGAGSEQCGTHSTCGYGARWDINTTRCVCVSDTGDLVERNCKSFTLFYCLGGGVTACGDQLCGYRAKCFTNTDGCRCSSSNDVLEELKGTYPSLWYCVETCDLKGSGCPDNTTCTDSSGNKTNLCQCSEGATLSSTGQCLGKPPNVTTEGDSPSQRDDFRTLNIGLAAGIGGVVLVVVIVLVVVVLARRRKSKRTNENESARKRRQSSSSHSSNALSRHTYQSVVDPALPGQSGIDNPAGPTVVVRTEVPVINPPSRPGAYENEANNFSVIYSTAKVTDKGDKCKTYQAQEANNAITLPSQAGDKAQLNGLYSNHAIPFNKAQQRNKNQKSSEKMENQYNTLYDLRPGKGNTASARDDNYQPTSNVPRGDLEYDEIKLQKV